MSILIPTSVDCFIPQDATMWWYAPCFHKQSATGMSQGEEHNMHIIAWILFGLVAGVIAKFLMPGRDPGGFFITILLGIAGSFLGGLVGRAVGLYQPGQRTARWIMSIIGAIVILAIYRLIVRRRTV
jgi:uncharacterized membrane protein YeaQ/YmgE (transglycosylase-associated protein family)